jgi:predicted kinase
MIIMRGLPASGKSTRAKEIMEKDGNAVRINKDLLRTMLHFDNFTGRNESFTKACARDISRNMLLANVNVIIDDTNLNPKTMQSWKDLAMECGAKVEVIDITDVPVEECVMRDLDREKYVGGTVIKNMALQYGLTDRSPYVLCDIDGTIADCSHRLKYAKGETKDWNKFFSLISEDTVRDDTRKMLVDYYNKGFTVIFVSARPEDYKQKTLEWLKENGIGFAWTLIMRRSNDKRQDTDVKKDLLDTYFKDKSQIHCVIDDRPSVIRMWKEEGLNVIDVGQGIEF